MPHSCRHLPVFALAAVVLLVMAPQARAQERTWHQHATEHFRFIYRESDSDAAAELVSFAEEVYGEVTRLLGVRPDRVDVVLYGETDLANGFYTPAPPQHLALYTRPPTLPFIGGRSEGWLRLLLIHELTHYVHANYGPGPFSVLGSVFGRSLTGLSIGFAPLWFTEGMAVHVETELSSGGRGIDAGFEAQYKAPIVEDRFFDLRQIGYDSYLFPAGRYYPGGYLVWEYLVETYGLDVSRKILEEFAAFPFFGVRGPIRRATGDRLPEIYAMAEVALEARYADAIFPAGARITPAERVDYHVPRISADRLYSYRTRPDSLPAIVTVDPDSGEEEVVLEMRLTDSESWSVSRDGSLVAFATASADRTLPDQPAIHSDVYLYDTGAQSIRKITTGGGYFQPAIDADVIYAIRRNGQASSLVALDWGGDETVVLALPETTLSSPAVSPDGGSVAVVANTQGRQRLLIVDTTNGDARGVSSLDTGIPYHPRFLNSETVLYAADPGGLLSLYEHDVATDDIRLVAGDPVAIAGGVLHDGEYVYSAYTADGLALRRTPYRPDRTAEPLPADRPTPDTADAVLGIEATESEESTTEPSVLQNDRYLPLPVPRFWLPAATIAGTELALDAAGFGTIVYAADYLGRNQLQLGTYYFPWLGLASWDLLWSRSLGRLAVTFAHAAPLVVDPDGTSADRGFTTSVGTTFDLVSGFHLGVAREVQLLATAAHAWQASLEHRLVFSGGVGWSRTPSAPAEAFYAPGARSARLLAGVPLDGPAFALTGVRGSVSSGIAIGLGRSNTVIFRPALTWATTPELLTRLGVAGFASANATADDDPLFSGRLGIELRTRRLLMDVPLFPNTGITSLSWGVSVEGAGSASSSRTMLEPDLGLRAEMTATIAFLTDIPVSTGVRLRVPIDGSPIDLGEDFRLYLTTDILESIPDLP